MKFVVPSGESIRVDNCDADLTTSFPWSRHWTSSGFYVSCLWKGRRIYLHRMIARSLPGNPTHHWDGDWTNCTRDNLRICTFQENSFGFRKRATRYRSRFRGVSFYKRDQKWRAHLMKDYRQLHLGYFATEHEAARAYDAAARTYFGEFAQLNFL